MNLTRILKKPSISEKSQRLASEGRFVFLIDHRASKNDVKKAVESQFEVKVSRVRTLRTASKPVRPWGKRLIVWRSAIKKAIVQLAPGQTIDIFETGEKEEKKKKKDKKEVAKEASQNKKEE